MNDRRRRRRRPGFTLLEVVLATAIAVMLLGALYVAVDLQLGLAQDGRDLVEESTLARGVLFSRMDNDGAQAVNLSDPARFRLANAATTTTDSASSTPASTTTNTATGAASSSSSSSSTTPTTTSDGSAPGPIVIPLGVQGDSETLHLYISRLPLEAWSNNNTNDTPPLVSDLRRVSYWLVGGDGSPTGLGRQEVAVVTSDDALQNLPPGIDNEASYILAEEVVSLNFQYYDGTDWQDSWDSTTMGADGVTPIGSPRAIAVTIGITAHHSSVAPLNDVSNPKFYRHVIAIPSANGTTVMTQPTPGSSSSTGTGGGVTP
jgi:prepilin-type N-terminal cleavage/methylation domain-containing protein